MCGTGTSLVVIAVMELVAMKLVVPKTVMFISLSAEPVLDNIQLLAT